MSAAGSCAGERAGGQGGMEPPSRPRSRLPITFAPPERGGLEPPAAPGLLWWHLLSLQQLLLLLPVGVHQLLRDQLHQLQALLYLHQDLEVLPASHLGEGTSPGLRSAPVPPDTFLVAPFPTRPHKVGVTRARDYSGLQVSLGHEHSQMLFAPVLSVSAQPPCSPIPPRTPSPRHFPPRGGCHHRPQPSCHPAQLTNTYRHVIHLLLPVPPLLNTGPQRWDALGALLEGWKGERRVLACCPR